MPQRLKDAGLLGGSVVLTFVSAFWLWQRLDGTAIFPPYPIIAILLLGGIWGVFSSAWNLLANHRGRTVVSVALAIAVPFFAFVLASGAKLSFNDTIADEAAREVLREMEAERHLQESPHRNPDVDAVESAVEAALEEALLEERSPEE